MLPMAIAVILHELAHLAVLHILNGRIKSFGAAPFGLCIEYDSSSLSLKGEALVNAAGGIINLFFAAASVVLYCIFRVDLLNFGIVSFLVALVNLIPAEPLDGGKLLHLGIASAFKPFVACKVSAIVTYVFGFMIFLFSSYMLLTSVSGIYPLLFSVYIFVCNSKTLEKVYL